MVSRVVQLVSVFMDLKALDDTYYIYDQNYQREADSHRQFPCSLVFAFDNKNGRYLEWYYYK